MATSLDAQATDDTPLVTLLVENQESGAYETIAAKSYSYEQDVTTISDSFAITAANPDGIASQSITPGSRVQFNIADRDVEGGQRTTQLVGIVTSVDDDADIGGGMTLNIRGADYGWHIVNNCAPLWLSLGGKRWQQILEACIDKSWGLKGVRAGNQNNRRIKLGRAGVVAAQQYKAGDIYPRFQTDIGQDVASILTEYAKRENWFINVSADGYLQYFEPDYKQESIYRFEYHGADNADRIRNNVQRSSLRRSIDGLYTDITLVWEEPINWEALVASDAAHPNAGKYKARVKDPKALPFTRRITTSDGEAWTTKRAKQRVNWFHRRGKFDSWIYTVTVKGHSQGGRFFVPDTMCEVDDTVRGIRGNYYVSACSYARDMSGGTTTTLTIRMPNLLTAFV